MVTAKSKLARMLAVLMVSATLMSAVPAQAGAADVGKRVKSALYGTGRVAGVAANGILVAFGMVAAISPDKIVSSVDKKSARCAGLLMILAGVSPLITLFKSLKNGDRVVEQEETAMSAVPCQGEVAGVGRKARRTLYGVGRVAGLALNGFFVVGGIKKLIFPDANVKIHTILPVLYACTSTVITLCKSLKNGDNKEAEQKKIATAVEA